MLFKNATANAVIYQKEREREEDTAVLKKKCPSFIRRSGRYLLRMSGNWQGRGWGEGVEFLSIFVNVLKVSL